MLHLTAAVLALPAAVPDPTYNITYASRTPIGKEYLAEDKRIFAHVHTTVEWQMPPAAAFLSSADADQLGLDLKNKFGAVARPPNPEPAKFNMGEGIIQLTQDALLPSDPTATGGISLTG